MGKVFTQPRSKKGFHLASSAPSIWSWLGGETIGFVVVHRLRDLPWNRGWLKNLPNLISSVGMSTDSVGLDSRNAFTKSSLNSFLFRFSFSCFILSWNFSQILFSVLGGGRLVSQPWVPHIVLYSPVKKGWWSIQLVITPIILAQVVISDPSSWTLRENLRTIAIGHISQIQCVTVPELFSALWKFLGGHDDTMENNIMIHGKFHGPWKFSCSPLISPRASDGEL